MIRFTANADFHSDETHSDYVAGLSYTVRAGNTKLLELMRKWLAEGKVTLGGVEAELTGRG
jgi:hypothetical protein